MKEVKDRDFEEIQELDRRVREALLMASEDYEAHFMNLMRRYIANTDSMAPIGFCMFEPWAEVFDQYHAERNAQLLPMLDRLTDDLVMVNYTEAVVDHSRPMKPPPIKGKLGDHVVIEGRMELRKLFQHHHHGNDCLFYRKSNSLSEALKYYLWEYKRLYDE